MIENLNESTDLESFKSSAKSNKNSNVLVTQYGSKDDGLMVQVGVGMKYIQLSKADAAKVGKALINWSKEK